MPAPEKPKKPSKDFPLTPHASKRWCKKIGQKMYYFGTWGDPGEALWEYLAIKEELQAGIDPRKQRVAGGTTVGDLVNHWLDQQNAKVQASDLSPLSFRDYKFVGTLVVKAFGRTTPACGVTPADFTRLRNEVSARYAPSRMSKIVTNVRMLFSWGWEADHLKTPVKFGPDFKGASKRQSREARNATGKRLFTAEEIRAILAAASPQMRAMVFLGINCGLGNTDLARLRGEHLSGGVMSLPRSKTAIRREVPLWPETIAALDEARAVVRKANSPSNEGLLFLTSRGNPWTEVKNDELVKSFRKLLKGLGLYRSRCTFYALRHTCQTVGDEVKDPVAVSAIMGHADSSMAGQYREEISTARLRAVTDHIRAWLIPTGVLGPSVVPATSAVMQGPQTAGPGSSAYPLQECGDGVS